MLSGQQDDRSWAGMNKVLDTIDGTAGFLEYSRDNFKKLADKLSGNDFKNSGEALKQIGNKYDATNSSYYGVTNPATGNSNYVIDMRKNFKNSLDSGMAALFLQREAYKTLLYNGLSLLSDQLSSETMNDIISSARGDVSEVREYIDDAKDFRDDMYDYTEKALDYWNLAKLILQAVYGVCVVAGIISLAALVLRSTFKKLKYVAKAFWGVIIVLVVAALLLTAVFFPVAVFVAESSDFLIYDDFIYNRDIIDKSLWNTISVCLVGDGNLDSVYNITDKLIFMRDIMEEFSIMDEIYAEGELKYVLNDEYIKSLIQIRDETPDAASSKIFSEEDPIGKFNDNCKNDKAVWTGKDCGTLSRLTSPWDDGGRCVVITEISGDNFDQHIGNRYAECPEYNSRLRSLVKYRDDLALFINELIGDVRCTFQAALVRDNEYSGTLALVIATSDIEKDLLELLQKVSNLLSTQLNCNFVRNSYNRVYESYSHHLSASITSIFLINSIASAFAIIAVLAILCICRRWNEPKIVATSTMVPEKKTVQ
eukprot:TRINITY_DN2066_c0_g1_i4.p1 TRINITY_DN2066_c0_g1~~TRINITY_DN2066_c0_g1_i4.p1  ORF type:complete len:538 (+),score=108.87 TRINITY_DN2066_c0_g1_i4:723-2336(+)